MYLSGSFGSTTDSAMYLTMLNANHVMASLCTRQLFITSHVVKVALKVEPGLSMAEQGILHAFTYKSPKLKHFTSVGGLGM